MLQRHTLVVENIYHQLGGAITVMIKEGHAHHPHSLQNAKPIADWIEQHVHPTEANRPAFVDSTFTKGHFYSLDNSFIYLKEEDTYATVRGPGFVPSYDRYDVAQKRGPSSEWHVDRLTTDGWRPGKPGADPMDRSLAAAWTRDHVAACQGILFGDSADHRDRYLSEQQWDGIYKLMVDNGFAKKVLLSGTGAKAGEAYAWAVANLDKVALIYARTPPPAEA